GRAHRDPLRAEKDWVATELQPGSRRSCSLSVPENEAKQAPDSLIAFFFVVSPLTGHGGGLLSREVVVVAPERTRLSAAGMQRTELRRFCSGDEDFAVRLRAIRRREKSRFGINLARNHIIGTLSVDIRNHPDDAVHVSRSA